MKLYLVQHAKATPAEVDPERPLTEEGLQDIQKVAEFIKPLNLSVDYLWHSGKKRAIQTADVLAKVIKINKEKTIHSGLGPNDDVTVFKNELLPQQQDVMIVGHMPFLGKLAALILTGDESANTVAFKQAGIICLNHNEQNQWQVEWMILPELLG